MLLLSLKVREHSLTELFHFFVNRSDGHVAVRDFLCEHAFHLTHQLGDALAGGLFFLHLDCMLLLKHLILLLCDFQLTANIDQFGMELVSLRRYESKLLPQLPFQRMLLLLHGFNYR